MSRLAQFHESAVVIDWWRSRTGKALAWLTPARRRLLLVVGALYVGFSKPLTFMAEAHGLPVATGGARWLVVLAVLGFLWLVFRAACRFEALPTMVRHYPQISLHLLFWVLLAVLWNTPPEAGPWRAVLLGLVLTLPFLIWRCGYLLYMGQSRRMAGTGFKDQLICLLPFWGGTETPYGKGHDYLSKFEARTDEELARSQLAGIKLLILSSLWYLLKNVFEGIVYGPGNGLTQSLGGHTLGIPKLVDLIARDAVVPQHLAWASIYCELIWQVLHLAVRGHQFIGVLRLFGFNVFRNTYKPLLAESVHDFWNRYYFYFKELLVTFFFMPAFMQLGGPLRHWPRLRLFIAVFAAASIGNTYYHMLKEHQHLVRGDVWGAILAMRSAFFYSLLLAGGIYMSMRRKECRGAQPLSSSRLARCLRIFGVWTFFSIIFIWDVRGAGTFSQRVHFFFHLFGLA